MRRTRFNNVVHLDVERKRVRLREKKAQHIRTRTAAPFRLGLMLNIDPDQLAEAMLTPNQMALCQALAKIPIGAVSQSKKVALEVIIRKLIYTSVVKMHRDFPGEYQDTDTAG
jgi:hypothetical protein